MMEKKSRIRSALPTIRIILIAILDISGGYSTFGGGRCHFPSTWRGSWFQSGLGSVMITEWDISHKGRCVENQRDYFIVDNRQDDCQQCLLIISRHPNLLQYKESYCIGPESMHSLCSKIRVEAVLYTLIRDSSPAVLCPFKNAFHFMYNNNSGGICRQPASYVHQCASNSKFRFLFRKCSQTAYSFERDAQFECLATWRDGSDEYLYGRFLFAEDGTKEEEYRCFMYTAMGTVLYLSMSADATCRGLRSSRDGPLVMELTEDSHGWPRSQCSLPQWFSTGSPWSELSRRQLYALHHDHHGTGPTLDYYYRKGSDGSSEDRVLASYTCVRTHFWSSAAEYDTVIMLAHVLADCQPRYQCLRIQRRHFYVAQLQKSDYFEDVNHKCTDTDFTESRYNQLLISEYESSSDSCPFEGVYSSTKNEHGCRVQVTAGCEAKSRMDLKSSCHTLPMLRLTCLLWWNEGETLFFLSRTHPHNASDTIACYVLSTVADAIELAEDSRCSHENAENVERFRFKNYLGECPLGPFRSEISEGRVHLGDRPENDYRYVVSDELTEAGETGDVVRPPKTFPTASGKNGAPGRHPAVKVRSYVIIIIVVVVVVAVVVVGILVHDECSCLPR